LRIKTCADKQRGSFGKSRKGLHRIIWLIEAALTSEFRYSEVFTHHVSSMVIMMIMMMIITIIIILLIFLQ
jgi:hypothetical protein